jgi:phthalate 4,5-dioxygenase oxygenase subunit
MRITHEMNERLTRVSEGTPMGDVLRRYWIPACLSEELAEPDGEPVRVMLLGEELVAFRDSAGEIGLVDAYCAHRRAPMFFGRNEECGLRCVFHGWKYDVLGNCVDMPSEPPYSKFRLRVSIKAYPTYEAAGIVWTYMGPTEQMPAPPDYEWMRAPETHRRVSKTGEECNYLQAMEGGIDTVHSSFAHNNDLQDARRLRSRSTNPTLEVEENDFGFRYASIRNVGTDESYVRVYAWTMPIQQMRAALLDQNGEPAKVPTIRGHLWVPIDDNRTYVYNWIYAADEAVPLTDEWYENLEARSGRGEQHFIDGSYWLKANLSNDFFVDREVQRTKTFTGIQGVNTQDFAIQSAMGPIVDRSKEALGSTDRAISSARRLLLEAADRVERDEPLRGTDPDDYRLVRPGDFMMLPDADWRDVAKDMTQAVW